MKLLVERIDAAAECFGEIRQLAVAEIARVDQSPLFVVQTPHAVHGRLAVRRWPLGLLRVVGGERLDGRFAEMPAVRSLAAAMFEHLTVSECTRPGQKRPLRVVLVEVLADEQQRLLQDVVGVDAIGQQRVDKPLQSRLGLGKKLSKSLLRRGFGHKIGSPMCGYVLTYWLYPLAQRTCRGFVRFIQPSISRSTSAAVMGSPQRDSKPRNMGLGFDSK